MDGTLLDSNACISPVSARILSDLTERGALVSVATARTPATVVNILEGVLTAPQLVVMTGSAVWNRTKNCFDSIQLIPEHDVRAMMQVFEQCGLSPFCYTLPQGASHIQVYHAAPTTNRYEQIFVDMRRNLDLKTFNLATPCPTALYNRVALFFGMDHKDAIVSAAQRLQQVTDCYISYYKDTYSDDMWLLEIFAPGVSKAAGIRSLAQRLGADRIVAFGDNLNDISMLKAADVAVAVENALPEVKEIAHCVIGPNTADSVAKFIADDFENSCKFK